MKLPDLWHVQREIKKVSRNVDKACTICDVSLRSISMMVSKDRWTNISRNDVISSHSCSLNIGIDHDHVTHCIAGGNRSHHLPLLL